MPFREEYDPRVSRALENNPIDNVRPRRRTPPPHSPPEEDSPDPWEEAVYPDSTAVEVEVMPEPVVVPVDPPVESKSVLPIQEIMYSQIPNQFGHPQLAATAAEYGFPPSMLQQLQQPQPYPQGQQQGYPQQEPPVEDKALDLRQVIGLLQQIAAVELAGVVMYGYFSVLVSGGLREQFSEVFAESRDESRTHYENAANLLMSNAFGWSGGRAYVPTTPNAEEMARVSPGDSQGSAGLYLGIAIAHEKKAMELYKQLFYLTNNKDCVLSNYAQDMAQTELVDLVEFEKLAGLS